REARGRLGAPEGPDRPRRGRPGDRPAGGDRGDRRRGRADREARGRPLRLHLGRRADLQDRQLLPRPLPPWPDRRRPARPPARGGGGPMAPARGGAPPARLQGREGDGGESAYDARGRRLHVKDDTMYALNFYSPMVADQLRSHRKTATIRLGDKSSKYKKGMVVSVLTGVRFGPRERVFDAVIDKVEVKQLQDLSPREIEHDNPEIRRPEEMATFLSQLYNREVTPEDTVTVIRFSQIVSRP